MCICGCRAAVPCTIVIIKSEVRFRQILFEQELRDHSPCTSREDSQVHIYMSAGMLCNIVHTNLYCRILLTVDTVQLYSADIGMTCFPFWIHLTAAAARGQSAYRPTAYSSAANSLQLRQAQLVAHNNAAGTKILKCTCF